MGLVVHELTTNALKYGAAQLPDIRVSWQRGADGRVNLRWQEPDARPVDSPKKGGFGSDLIRALEVGELHGNFERNVTDQGLRVDISF